MDNVSRDDSVVIHSAEDMCLTLLEACPDKAAAFARAQHERACMAYEDRRARFWYDVMELLSDADSAEATRREPRRATG